MLTTVHFQNILHWEMFIKNVKCDKSEKKAEERLVPTPKLIPHDLFLCACFCSICMSNSSFCNERKRCGIVSGLDYSYFSPLNFFFSVKGVINSSGHPISKLTVNRYLPLPTTTISSSGSINQPPPAQQNALRNHVTEIYRV